MRLQTFRSWDFCKAPSRNGDDPHEAGPEFCGAIRARAASLNEPIHPRGSSVALA
jgi:hypothetical protein